MGSVRDQRRRLDLPHRVTQEKAVQSLGSLAAAGADSQQRDEARSALHDAARHPQPAVHRAACRAIVAAPWLFPAQQAEWLQSAFSSAPKSSAHERCILQFVLAVGAKLPEGDFAHVVHSTLRTSSTPPTMGIVLRAIFQYRSGAQGGPHAAETVPSAPQGFPLWLAGHTTLQHATAAWWQATIAELARPGLLSEQAAHQWRGRLLRFLVDEAATEPFADAVAAETWCDRVAPLLEGAADASVVAGDVCDVALVHVLDAAARGLPAASLAALAAAATSGPDPADACSTRVALLCRALLECAEPLPDAVRPLVGVAQSLSRRPWRIETGVPWEDLPPAVMATALREALMLAQEGEGDVEGPPAWPRAQPLSRAPQHCARVAAEPLLHALCGSGACLESGGGSGPEEGTTEAARRLLACIPHEGQVLPPRFAPGLCGAAWAEERRLAVVEAEEARLRRIGRLPAPGGTATEEERHRLRCPGEAGGCWAAAALRGAEAEGVWREAPSGDRRPLLAWALARREPAVPRAGRPAPSSSLLSCLAAAAAALLAEGRPRPAAGALAAFAIGAWRAPPKGLRWLPLVARCVELVQGLANAPSALLEATCCAVAACGVHGSGVGAAASARVLQRLASPRSPAVVPALCALAVLWACNGKTWPRLEASLRAVLPPHEPLRAGKAEAGSVVAATVLRAVCRRDPPVGAEALPLIESLVSVASAAAPDAVLALQELCCAGALSCRAGMRACAAVARSGRGNSLFAPGRTLGGAPDSLVSAHHTAASSPDGREIEVDEEQCLEACVSLASTPLQLAVPEAGHPGGELSVGVPPSWGMLAGASGDDDQGSELTAAEVAGGAAALFCALTLPSANVRRRALRELSSAHPLCTGLVDEEEAGGGARRDGGDAGPVLAALATTSAALRAAMSHVAFDDPCEECRSAAARALGRAACVTSPLPRLQPRPLRRAGSDAALDAVVQGGLRDVEVPGYGRWRAAKRQRGWRGILQSMPDPSGACAAERPWMALIRRATELADSTSPPGQQQAEAEALVAGAVEAACASPRPDNASSVAWTWEMVHSATLCAHVGLRSWVLASRTLFFAHSSGRAQHRCLTVVDGVRALVRACHDAAGRSSQAPTALAWGAAALVAALARREGGESAVDDETARIMVEQLCRRGDSASQALARAVAPGRGEGHTVQWSTAPEAMGAMVAALRAERAASVTYDVRRAECVKAAWALVADSARAGHGGCTLGESVRRAACAHAAVVGPPTDPEAGAVLALLARSNVPVRDRDRVGLLAAADPGSLWELARGVVSSADASDVLERRSSDVVACAVLSSGGVELHPSLLAGAQRACEALMEADSAGAVDAVLALCGCVLPTLVHSTGVGSVGASSLSPKHENALREMVAAKLGAGQVAREVGARQPAREADSEGKGAAWSRAGELSVSVCRPRSAGVFDQLSEAASSVAGSEVSEDGDVERTPSQLDGTHEEGPMDDDVDALLGETGPASHDVGPEDEDVDALLGETGPASHDVGPEDEDVDALLGETGPASHYVGPEDEDVDAPRGSGVDATGLGTHVDASQLSQTAALQPWLALARAALTSSCSSTLALRDADLSDDASTDASAARALVWEALRPPYECMPVVGTTVETHRGVAARGLPLCTVGAEAGSAPPFAARLPSSSPLRALARAAEGACLDRPAGSRVRALDSSWVPTAAVVQGDCGSTGRAATLALLHACAGAALHTPPPPGLLAAARALPGGSSAAGRCTALRQEAMAARVLGRLASRHGDATAAAAALALGRCAESLARGLASGAAAATAWGAVGEGLPLLVGHGALGTVVEAIAASATRCPRPQRALFLLASTAPALSRCSCEGPSAARALCARLLRGVAAAVGAEDGCSGAETEHAQAAALVGGALLGAWVLGTASRGGGDECLSALPSALRTAPAVAGEAGLPHWLRVWALATAVLVIIGHGSVEARLAACAAAAGASADDARHALESSAWPRPSLPRAVSTLREAAWLQQQLLTALRDAVHEKCVSAAAGVACAAAELAMGAGACHAVQGRQNAGLLRFALGAKARATLLQAAVRAAGDLEAVDGGAAAREAGAVLARAHAGVTAVEHMGEAATTDTRTALALQS